MLPTVISFPSFSLDEYYFVFVEARTYSSRLFAFPCATCQASPTRSLFFLLALLLCELFCHFFPQTAWTRALSLCFRLFHPDARELFLFFFFARSLSERSCGVSSFFHSSFFLSSLFPLSGPCSSPISKEFRRVFTRFRRFLPAALSFFSPLELWSRSSRIQSFPSLGFWVFFSFGPLLCWVFFPSLRFPLSVHGTFLFSQHRPSQGNFSPPSTPGPSFRSCSDVSYFHLALPLRWDRRLFPLLLRGILSFLLLRLKRWPAGLRSFVFPLLNDLQRSHVLLHSACPELQLEPKGVRSPLFSLPHASTASEVFWPSRRFASRFSLNPPTCTFFALRNGGRRRVLLFSPP